MTWYIIVLNILELAACITGFVHWQKIKHSYWRWFPVYLGVIALIELIAEYILHVGGQLILNIGIYRYFGIPVQFAFFYWIFYQYFHATKKNYWPLYFGIIYTICWLVDISYIEGKIKLLFDSFSYLIGCILLLILMLIYFIRFIKSDEVLRYKSNMMFWVCVGLMFFYVGSLPFYGLRTTLYKQYRTIFYIYWYIQFGLNYLMYILFVISFIWGKPR